LHPEFHPYPTRVAELVQLKGWGEAKQQQLGARRLSPFRAFPSAAFQDNFTACMSLRVDRKNNLWALDHGSYGIVARPKIFVFALSQSEEERDRLLFEYTFPREVAGIGSFVNDLQVDAKGEWAYIADTSTLAMTPGLILFNSVSRTSYRVLSSHPSMFGESLFFSIGSHRVKLPGPLGFRVHVDSIALDRVNGRWLYFGAMTSDKMYAVATNDLKKYVTASEIGQPYNVTVHLAFDHKPITDGLSTDTMGNIYMTAVDMSAIVVAVAQREPQFDASLDRAPTPPRFNLHKLVQSDSYLRWPDGLSFGPRGLYVTASMLHAKFLGLDLNASSPFHILRVPHTTLQGLQAEAVFAEDEVLDFPGQ
jgi:sugar lactone lactonase YvrE